MNRFHLRSHVNGRLIQWWCIEVVDLSGQETAWVPFRATTWTMVGNRKEGLDAGKDGWTGTNGTAKTATIRAGCRVMAHTLHVEVWHLRRWVFFLKELGKGTELVLVYRGGVWYEALEFSSYIFIFLLCKYHGWMNIFTTKIMKFSFAIKVDFPFTIHTHTHTYIYIYIQM